MVLSPAQRRVYRVKYRPSVAQYHVEQSVREGRAKITTMVGGIGSGKTALGAHVTRRMMQEWAPRSIGGIVVPSYRTFHQVTLPEIRKFWPGEGTLWEFAKPDGHPEIRARCNGGGWSVGLVRSAQHERVADDIRGPNWAWFWGDEPATWHAGRYAYDLVIGRIRRRIGGWWPRGLITGSPRWGWLNKVLGIPGPMPTEAWTTGYYPRWDTKFPGPQGAYYVRATDTADNRNNDPGYRRFLELNYGEAFIAQELKGDFVAPAGAMFPRFYPHIHVIPHAAAMKMYERCNTRAAGVDWGYSSLAAMCAGGIDGDGRLILVRDWQGIEHTADMLASMALRWRENLGIQSFHMDPSNPDGACDSWEGRVTGATTVPGASPAENARKDGWDSLRRAMRLESALRHPVYGGDHPASWLYISDRCEHVIEAFRNLRRKELVSGESEYDETKDPIPKELTHIADTVRYLYYSNVGGFQAFAGGNEDL